METMVVWPETVAILGIDPGKHVGIAHFLLKRGTFGAAHPLLGNGYRLYAHSSTTVTGEENYIQSLHHAVDLLGRVGRADVKVVTCEQFVFTRTSMTGQQKDALIATGALKAWVWKQNDPDMYEFYSQKPSEAKTLVSNDVLKELNLKKYGDKKTDHELMAARHALLFAHKYTNRKITLK
ncbi:RuvC-like resolvase [Gordonia phage Phendrix]|uniref:RuvC-like resolvase n=2 Tax=Godonkavirus TaxID=2733178 RepID=A0A4D6E286_9CAUD|nr:RuvC-like resolvase [Gordonia phage GodonK]YP_010649188.1 RuvC-like resolvase [Gordonia phage Phendrix]QBZ72773.1 RuvC-like resolvase [Gordonia phage GodonK]QDK02690.1 RuvC-like resolvase [Gordonia phage Phendrix]